VQTREAQVECDVCIPGYVADSAGTGCLGCPAGRHEQLPAGFPFDRFGRPCVEPNGVNNAEGCRSLECEDCLAGQYQDQVGETECNPAGYGHYVAVAGANNQSLCPLTQYQDTRGQTHCKTCTPGRQPNSGMIRTHCEWCLPGHFSPIGLKCHACESGQYQPSNGSRACHHAEPGSYVDLKMATHQWDCPDGSYAPSPGTVNCGPCRGGHTNNNESVVSLGFPSCKRSILTEIYLCHVCSCHEIEDGNACTGLPRLRPGEGGAQAVQVPGRARRVRPLPAGGGLRVCHGARGHGAAVLRGLPVSAPCCVCVAPPLPRVCWWPCRVGGCGWDTPMGHEQYGGGRGLVGVPARALGRRA
jgi:hypothetical protein